MKKMPRQVELPVFKHPIAALMTVPKPLRDSNWDKALAKERMLQAERRYVMSHNTNQDQ